MHHKSSLIDSYHPAKHGIQERKKKGNLELRRWEYTKHLLCVKCLSTSYFLLTVTLCSILSLPHSTGETLSTRQRKDSLRGSSWLFALKRDQLKRKGRYRGSPGVSP